MKKAQNSTKAPQKLHKTSSNRTRFKIHPEIDPVDYFKDDFEGHQWHRDWDNHESNKWGY